MAAWRRSRPLIFLTCKPEGNDIHSMRTGGTVTSRGPVGISEDLLVSVTNIKTLRANGMKLLSRFLQPDPYGPRSLETLFPSHLERVTADNDYWK